jgi:hypothetical protein
MDIKKSIAEIDIDKIADPAVRVIIIQLLNIIEQQAQEIKELKEENQRLRDENARLKGEKGKPDIRPQKRENKDLSSEKERKRNKKKKKKQSKNKKDKIKIDRVERCDIPTNQLPTDAVFKGYQNVTVQDIIIKTDNIEFQKAVYYSPSLHKTFIAPLPAGYSGEFGPNLKTLVLVQHFVSKMTEPEIVRFLKGYDIHISAATVSRMITDNHGVFHSEKQDIVKAGILSTVYQQMDDTSARVNGINYFTHVLCNPFYTAYFTKPRKDRLTILEILSQGELTFQFDDSAYVLMIGMGLPNKTLDGLKDILTEKIMKRQQVEILLNHLFPEEGTHSRSRQIIREASAIAHYQQQPDAVKILLTDDAPQFKQITALLALCWVHDGRHYKKLEPVFPWHRKKLDNFLERFWDYYHRLLHYTESPKAAVAEQLTLEFDVLFSTKTYYKQLDERIARTKEKKDSLLIAIQYPELPLHNNGSELGARSPARYRDISFQTKNEKGTEGRDTFMTITETARKLAVNVIDYIHDRVSQNFQIPSLANLIRMRSNELICNTS